MTPSTTYPPTPSTMRLHHRGDGIWETDELADGRHPIVFISRDDTFETECDNDHPHPVKIRVDTLTEAARNAERENARKIAYGDVKEIQRVTKHGWATYLTYQCPGGELHYYSQWTVQIWGEWLGDDGVHDTLGSAIQAAQDALGGVKLIRTVERKPKTTPVEQLVYSSDEFKTWSNSLSRTIVNGRSSWTACGHPAELDIDNHCYTCHQRVDVEVPS